MHDQNIKVKPLLLTQYAIRSTSLITLPDSHQTSYTGVAPWDKTTFNIKLVYISTIHYSIHSSDLFPWKFKNILFYIEHQMIFHSKLDVQLPTVLSVLWFLINPVFLEIGEIILNVCIFSVFSLFSSPELKAQVSFSDHLSSVVCLSVRPSVRPSVCLSVCL